VVNHMLELIEKHLEVKFHQLFFDNFSSHALMKSLTDRHVAATRTIRELRTGGTQKELRDTKYTRKTGKRGEFDYCCDGSVFMVKWHDNSDS